MIHINLTRPLLAILLLASQVAFGQTWNWGQNTGSTVMGQTTTQETAVSSSGDVYVIGTMTGDITFGTWAFTNQGWDDVFLAKYSHEGILQWAKQIGGTDFDGPVGVATDGSGNAYIALTYNSPSVTIGGIDYTNIGGDTVNPGMDQFPDNIVAKIDASGSWQWVKNINVSGNDYLTHITADAAGNVYMAGYSEQAGTLGTLTIPVSDCYIVKLDSTGTPAWVANGGSDSPRGSAGSYLALNPQGTVLGVTGGFTEAATFGSIHLTDTWGSSPGEYNAFAATLNTSTGNWTWADQMGGESGDYGVGIAIDFIGNVYAGGSYLSPELHIGDSTLLAYDQSGFGFGQNTYMVKYSPAGAVLWTANAPGSIENRITDLSLTGDGDVYVSGIGSDTAFFGTNPIVWSLSDYNPYLARISGADGVWQWAVKANEIEGCACGHLAVVNSDLAVSSTGTLYYTSYYGDSARFGDVQLIGPLFFSSGSGQTQGYVLGIGDQLPLLNTISPAVGGTGTMVTITGTRLNTTTKVTVNDREASFNAISSTELRVVIPTGATSGLIRVSTTGGETNTPIPFRVEGPADIDPKATQLVGVWPNPAHGSALVCIASSKENRAITLHDGLGRVVHKQILAAGDQQTNLNLQGLTPGLYTVRAEGQAYRLTVQ